ncbi:enoyl-CoA hydratase-related protein [Rhodobacteraceae bacterium KMM 6894]|nr:enoyl-CoA hydratase-related protein [Rhodobacteraceae bacterium KMM 6894]
MQQQDHGAVRVLALAGGASGVLTTALRADLIKAIQTANGAPEVQAIVLTGAQGSFSAGINVMDYDVPMPEASSIGTLTRAIEDSAKPVIAAIEGAALGAGLAVALAAQVRVARRGARLAAPDLKLGLVPSGGVTQRLPRMIGAAAALDLMLSGRSVLAGDPLLEPLLDAVVDSDPVPVAIALAGRLAQTGLWTRSGQRRDGLADPAAYAQALAAARGGDGAAAAIVSCVEGAQLLPFEQGLEMEQTLFDESLASDASRVMRHLMIVQRRAATVPGIPLALARPVTDVVLTGPRGPFAEVTMMALDAGWRVWLSFDEADRAGELIKRVAQMYDGAVARGRLDVEARDARIARLHNAPAPEAQLVLEMGGRGVEGPEGAARVRITESDGVRPVAQGGLMWLRLHAPAHIASLAELALPEGVDPAQAATLVKALSDAGKIVLRSAPMPGMLGRNMDWAVWTAALALVAAGHSPYAVDAGAEALGYAIGPFRQMDTESLKVVVARLDHLATVRAQPPHPASSLLRRLIAQGQTGLRAGQGVYTYGGASPQRRIALEEGAVDPAQCARALKAAVINESARLLATGIAMRACDIEVLLLKGYGLDPAQGGLLFGADQEGLLRVERDMKQFQPLAPHIWAPHAYLQQMIRDGVGFFGRTGMP